MQELARKTDELNKSRKVIRWANILLIYLSFEVIRVLVIFKISESALISPLIPDHVNCLIFADYVDGGLIASSGFISALFSQIL